ncbi:serine/threonine-protein kinase HipA [Idiomarina loihiensis]|uniref:type II toxin-antitoxin system HipA family toxin n=1 Tax=Idiomarina TaxID=135575 RepID=UPI000D97C308|nr:MULTISPECIES: HipA domain-containing protein [Idiomarina]PWW36963.1 serine/threonine-protein kinase HipA [Idiomarina loihiensis]TDP46771.1 serine/threonine-protein kinase HipA [Idiomarina loihiensis]TDS23042.1 serine/threonine-protein kinase HipA [Idiomarina sp. H2]
MMTSESIYKEAYVWIWLPGETTPVVAGKLEADGENLLFNYGKNYLARVNEKPSAIPIYEPELPLKQGVIPNLQGLSMPGCIRDAALDAWGRRVVINKLQGNRGDNVDTAELDELTYLLESGSDRIGALDFQLSPTEYVPRSARNATMEELIESAERVEKGIPLTPELDQALYHGSSIGGARPKALIEQEGIKYIAKFSASNDLYSVVKAEFIAMRLASLAGLNVAPVQMAKAAGKDVILIERFDRKQNKSGWMRKPMVSALTLFELDDMMARYASYETLAEIIRRRFSKPQETLKELFSRLVFNILCGNTDDHARNHAAFWDGNSLNLTPAYDICPQGRTRNEQGQAMLIVGNNNASQMSSCLKAAPNFLLKQDEALAIFENQKSVIEQNWQNVCDEAELSEVDRKLFWGRQFLNPFSLQT